MKSNGTAWNGIVLSVEKYDDNVDDDTLNSYRAVWILFGIASQVHLIWNFNHTHPIAVGFSRVVLSPSSF